MISLKKGQTIHLMGICGTAMASLAGLLKEKGFNVTGSDQNPYPPMSTQLEKLGINIMKGYSVENLAHKPDLVIVGNVITKVNPEAVALLNSNIPYTSLPKAIGEWVIEDRESIVIAGTHGKTTTTSLMAWIAEHTNKKAGFLIGGIPRNFSYSFRVPQGDYFIIEGDEYDTAFFDKVPKFIHYKPRHVVLTSIEFDHADIYKNLDEVKTAFRNLLTLIPANGTLVYHAKDANIGAVLEYFKGPNKVSYGFNRADYMAKFVSQDDEGSTFQVFHNSYFLGEFFIPLHGDFNILNATATIAMADQLDWNIEKTRESLESFLGIKRRQELIGEPKGIKIIEDFAHHPTAVLETVKAVQKRFQGKRVFSVFEPRSATSRRKIFQKDYVNAFKQCQEVILAEPYDQSKIEEGDRFSVSELISDLKSQSVRAQSFAKVDDIVEYLGANTKTDDIILIMSNGAFDGIYNKLLAKLS
jgi:UDP-N-acetylmuramate: L-alanyl-gamma-D-glutamyl-meso-diaminopimelate ligase